MLLWVSEAEKRIAEQWRKMKQSYEQNV